MVRTRGMDEAGPSDPGAGELPHPPSLAEAIAAILESRDEQTGLLRQLVQNSARAVGREGQQGPRASSYADFLATHPPMFHVTTEPLDADTWIRTIESKFELLHCTEIQKAHFAAQQLEGSANDWWANYIATLAPGHQVTWIEFKAAFRAHHIPEGLIRRKNSHSAKEIRKLL